MSAGGHASAFEPPADANKAEPDATVEPDVDPCSDGCGVSCASAFPVMIPACRIPPGCEERPLRLENTFIDNLGFTTLDYDQPAAVNLISQRIRNYAIDAACSVGVGDVIRIMNGNPVQPVGQVLREVLDPDGDGAKSPLSVHVPVVYDKNCDLSFNEDHTVVGFAVFRIEDVALPSDPEPETYLDGTMLCGEAERPCGGGDFGLHAVGCE